MLHNSGALIYLGLVAVFISDSFANDVEDNWQLVFHAVKGNGKDVRDAWNARSPSVSSPGNGCLSPGFKLDNCRDNKKHLRSPLIDQWESIGIQKIRVVLGRNGNTLAFLKFDGSGSNKLNWFSKSRLLHNSWSDLKTARTNVFSIKGHDRDGRRPVKRHFFVNKRYGGCANDVGWFVIIDKTDLCPWTRKGRTPLFLYRRGSKAANWNRSSWHIELNYGLLSLPNQDIGLMVDVTGRQGMLTPPRILIPPLVYPEDLGSPIS